MMIYNSYYRNYGLRRMDMLISPVRAPLAEMDLPRSSLYHYVPQTASDVGPRNDELVFRSVNRAVSLMFMNEPRSLVGNPRVRAIDIQSKVKDFYLQNRNYRRLKDLASVEGSVDVQVAVSYSLINERLHYIVTKYSAYQQWYNVAATAWKNIADVARQSQRHQFVPIYIPQSIPSPATLSRFSDEMTIQGLTFFQTPEDYMLLEIWKWLTDRRSKSILNAVRPEDLHKINLLFVDRNCWYVLNLARINAWRIAPAGEVTGPVVDFEKKDSEDDAREGKNKQVGDGAIKATNPQKPILLAKMFLRGLMSITGTREQSADEVKQAFAEAKADVNQPMPSNPVAPTGVKSELERAAEQEADISDEELAQLRAFRARQQTNLLGTDLGEDIDIRGEDDFASELKLAEKVSRATQRAEASDVDAKELDAMSAQALAELETSLDEDFQVLETIEKKRAEREAKLSEEAVSEELLPLPAEEPYSADPAVQLMKLCDDEVEHGLMTGSDYRRFERLSTKFHSITMPNGQSLAEFVKIDPKDLEVEVPKPTVDKFGLEVPGSEVGSVVEKMNSQYIEKVMDRDIAAMVLSVQQGGLALTDMKIKELKDITGHDREYTVRLVPIEGEPTTIKFTYPIPNKRGVFRAGGVDYRFRLQQGVSMPIKKTDEREVVLTSYYGKTFIRKPDFKVSDYQSWICNQIRAADLQGKGVSNVTSEPDLSERWRCPLYFTYIGREISSFQAQALGKSYQFNFQGNEAIRTELFGEQALKQLEHAGARIIAKSNDGDYLVMENDNSIARVTTDGLRVEAGSIEMVLGFNARKAPVEYTQLSTMGQEIPIGFILGYYYGFTWLLRRFRPKFRKLLRGAKASLQDHEYMVQFADETFIFDRREIMNTLIFSGWNKYRNSIRNYTFREFNDQGVYMNVLEDSGVSFRILSELKRMKRMFVDPITRDLLIEMKEPVEFDKLLIRATELLVDGYVPLVRDRVRGYERFAGAFYHEIVRTMRAHDNRYGRNKAKLDFNPTEVNKAILSDSAKMQVTEINPIEDIKQIEAISHSGTGGRSPRALTQSSRVYKMEEHSGLVSEATVDNDKVAVNAYMAANPKIVNLRGINEPYDPATDKIDSLVSTSMLVSPASDRDDGKRVNFINIQHGHGISCVGYRSPIVRTGEESKIAQRTSDIFATIAERAGTVVSSNKDGIIVEYDNGERVGVQLGRRYGGASSLTYPFTVVTDLKAGEKVEAGDAIAYNTNFFERDYLVPKGVIWKSGTPMMVALTVSPATYEDSSAVSRQAAERLTTFITERRAIVVNFDQAIHEMVKAGQKVDVFDSLCVVEDSLTSGNDMFKGATAATLRQYGADAPRAKVKGTVEGLEIRYNGDKADMSPSLRAIADTLDRQMAAVQRASGQDVLTGRTYNHYRVEGKPLMPKTAVITVLITHEVPYSVGDKSVLGNQLKTVNGDVVDKPMVTESGVVIDKEFGSIAVGARIVRNPYLIGTTSRLAKRLGEMAVDAYQGKDVKV